MEYSITDELNSLKDKAKELSPDGDRRTEIFSQYHALSERFLKGLESKNTYDDRHSDPNLYTIHDDFEEPSRTISTLENDLFVNGINAASGGHLGYIPGGGIYTSAIADYLAAISNVYSGVYYASPGAVEMEHACLNWLKSIFNFPSTAVGNLTSGGSIATLIALCAARDHQKILENDCSKSVIYLTDQTHHSSQKSLRIIGLQNVTMRIVPTDQFNRMDVDQLELIILNDKKEGLYPSIVIANVGTTDTGAIDPLAKIATVAEKNNLWYHVDAAYGGFFILTDKVKAQFKGIEKADSLVCDPHKGMFLPYGIGAVLVKDKQAVFASNKTSGNYMQDTLADDFPVDPSDVSPELTKHFRALRMWLPLKTHGVAPFKAALEEKLLLVHYFRDEVVKLGFKIGPAPDLSITYFWFPFKNRVNEKNQKLMENCHKDGRVFLSSTKMNEQFVIRMAILSFRSHKNEIDKTLAMLKESLEKIKE